MITYTIRVTLLGRHDGTLVSGVGVCRTVGTFTTFDLAKRAKESWESDRTYRWSAEIKRGKGEVGFLVDVGKRQPRRGFMWRGTWRRR